MGKIAELKILFAYKTKHFSCLCGWLHHSAFVNLSSSWMHLHLSGLLGTGAGWWAVRLIGTEHSVIRQKQKNALSFPAIYKAN